MRTHRWFSLFVLLLGGLLSRGADVPARLDAYGDPFPEGILARLGTVRYRIGEEITSVALSPDGKTFAVGGTSAIVLLDAASGRIVKRLAAGKTSNEYVTFSPNGKVLASIDKDKMLCLWDFIGGKLLRRLPTPDQRTIGIAFSDDGKLVATECELPGEKFSLPIWEVSTGKLATMLKPPSPCEVVRLRFSPDNKTLAVWGQLRFPPGGRDGESSLQLWEFASGKVLHKFHVEPRSNLLFTPNGKTLVLCGGAGKPEAWDVATGKRLRQFFGPSSVGQNVALSPDGKVLAASGLYGTVQLWDFATARPWGEHRLPLADWAQIAYGGDGKLLAWSSNRYSIDVWDIRREKQLSPTAEHRAGINAIKFTTDGRSLLSVASDGLFRKWNLSRMEETVRQQLRLHAPEFRDIQFCGAVLDPHLKYVLLSAGYSASLWDLEAGCDRLGLEASLAIDQPLAAFSGDGRRVACGINGEREKKAVILLSAIGSGQRPREFVSDQEELLALALTPDGTRVAAAAETEEAKGGRNYELRLWDLTSDKGSWFLVGKEQKATGLAFSPDGRTLAVASPSGDICCRDAATGDVQQQLKYPAPIEFSRMAFSPDGRTLAVAGSNKVLVWELSSGTLRQELVGHYGNVTALAFSPDGATLATGGSDTTVLLWDMSGRARQPTKLAGHDKLWSVLENSDGRAAFAAMGQMLASPTETLALFQKQLRAVPPLTLDAAGLARLIADLDHKQFQQREKTAAELRKMGDRVIPALRRVLENKPALELSRRIRELLRELESPVVPPPLLRSLRAVEVLERLNTPESQRLLQTLAAGDSAARLTREAAAALKRRPEPEKTTPLPRVVGHRGLIFDAPENTLAGIAASLELRIGFEFDIRRSKDGVLVCMHDATVDRTTNGKGKVADLTLAELKKLDAGSWLNPAFSDQRVPTLEEVCLLLKQRGKPGALAALDLKVKDEKLAGEAVKLAREHGVVEYCLCIGEAIDDPVLRRALRQADSKIGIAVLAQTAEDLDAALKDEHADWAYVRFVPTAEQVERVHKAGMKVFLAGKTVAGREPENWKRAKDAGIDALLTDHPLECRQIWRK